MHGARTLEKERLGAFMDAVVAIIMTILVLELERPETLSWQALWDMRMSFVAYAVSFFGIAVMWTTWRRDWHDIAAIGGTTAMGTDQIAYLLGYLELNSFLRAFNSWCGMSPSEWRRTKA